MRGAQPFERGVLDLGAHFLECLGDAFAIRKARGNRVTHAAQVSVDLLIAAERQNDDSCFPFASANDVVLGDVAKLMPHDHGQAFFVTLDDLVHQALRDHDDGANLAGLLVQLRSMNLVRRGVGVHFLAGIGFDECLGRDRQICLDTRV